MALSSLDRAGLSACSQEGYRPILGFLQRLRL